MDPRLIGPARQLAAHTRLYLNGLDGIDGAASLARPGGTTNNIAFLDEPSGARFPVGDKSVLGAIAFLLHHEAYHIGQLALLRRFTGALAMSYR